MLPTRIAGIEMTWPAALVNVRDQHHVTILGKGTIDGDGPIPIAGFLLFGADGLRAQPITPSGRYLEICIVRRA
jgi:hypothetical protein